MTSPTSRLAALLKEVGAYVTFDADRAISGPCFNCGTTDAPRSLVVVGTWSRQVGNRGKAGSRIERPMCAACVESTAPTELRTWRYHLPSIKGEGWAIVYMDSIGVFTCVSDWGDYGYRWPQAGWGPGDFRKFFLQCYDEYILRKIARPDVYDGEATLRAVKERILEARRHGSWSRDRARREWDRLEVYGHLDSREDFAMWYEDTDIDEAYGLSVYSFSGEVRGFIEHVLPRLREAIKKQLEAEGLAT